MPDFTYDEVVQAARKRHGQGVQRAMDDLTEVAERMRAGAIATGVSLDDIEFPVIPYAPGEAEALANWVMNYEERQKRPFAKVRRWLRRTFGV